MTEYLEDVEIMESQEVGPPLREPVMTHVLQKAESTRYSQVAEDIEEEDEEEESKVHIETHMQDGDLQAW
eukprot:CAMPEP_0170476786 /NCGR_PEP_ID=MMETSP0123-20130129/18140_1 /TAXON_ID=182087 /ORGANISM="Favella ehrenbergii, Strain Fehren 1" /LENGTH=69 /DNA_ID=CAMNT_0010748051 /DNA_START=3250 /DNA_END=3456 /DNA_ORIENTATION=-